MAAQRQSIVRPALATCSNTCGSPTPTAPSRQNSTTVGEDVTILRPGDETAKAELKREAERQTRFQKVSNDILDIPSGYRKVEVLIIRWDESIDEFKGHKEEIERLQTIFTIGFGYNCRVARIKNCQNPQIGLNLEILQHLHQHDGDNNLLIVYYTGHGNQVVNENGRRLELSATEGSEETGGHLPIAFWDKAEEPLRTLAAGDVLAILDCCFASSAAVKGRNEEFRTYQLLAASSPDGPTSGPGEKSFTTALCDSLQELLRESQGESFPVLKLWERINTKRTAEAALIWDRLGRYHKRSVQLGRLDPNPERDASFRKEEPEKASLVLRLSLKADDLDDKQIDKLARQLPVACKEAGVPVRRMEWVKMEQRKPKQVFREAVKTVRMNLRRKSSPGKLQQQSPSPELRKRTRSDTSSLSTPKRQARESPSTSASAGDSGRYTPTRSRSGR